MGKSLILWTKNGSTLKFEQVTNVKQDATNLAFRYHGVSTDTTRDAIFHMTEIVGLALSVNP